MYCLTYMLQYYYSKTSINRASIYRVPPFTGAFSFLPKYRVYVKVNVIYDSIYRAPLFTVQRYNFAFPQEAR